jgi:hypothetical protein
MRTPTIRQVAAQVEKKFPKYFTATEMKFFGQTMSSFTVKVSPTGRVFFYAPCTRPRESGGGRVFSHFTFKEVVGDTLVTPREKDDALVNTDKLSSILNFIGRH